MGEEFWLCFSRRGGAQPEKQNPNRPLLRFPSSLPFPATTAAVASLFSDDAGRAATEDGINSGRTSPNPSRSIKRRNHRFLLRSAGTHQRLIFWQSSSATWISPLQRTDSGFLFSLLQETSPLRSDGQITADHANNISDTRY
ncbi:hypothetical protein AAC387_Pa12g1758 [Persea americana]